MRIVLSLASGPPLVVAVVRRRGGVAFGQPPPEIVAAAGSTALRKVLVVGADTVGIAAGGGAAVLIGRGRGVEVLVCRPWVHLPGHRLVEAGGLLGGDFPAIHVLGETTAPHGERYEPRNLRAHGRVERAEVDAWMSRASVYVAPSRYEPFGLAPLEAALHGCALVLSDIGTFRELWHGCAEFVPSGDAPALAGALRALRDDPARVARLAGGARKRALRRYTSGRMAEEYIALYRQLAQRHALRQRAQAAIAAAS